MFDGSKKWYEALDRSHQSVVFSPKYPLYDAASVLCVFSFSVYLLHCFTVYCMYILTLIWVFSSNGKMRKETANGNSFWLWLFSPAAAVCCASRAACRIFLPIKLTASIIHPAELETVNKESTTFDRYQAHSSETNEKPPHISKMTSYWFLQNDASANDQWSNAFDSPYCF